jgi:hypothetical protein
LLYLIYFYCVVSAAHRGEAIRQLSVFSNSEYVQDTPLDGGMEGWLSTTGFNIDTQALAAIGKRAPWKRFYFILKDSHLLMFQNGDAFAKPRGVMYLVGTITGPLPDNSNDVPNRFTIQSRSCVEDSVELAAASLESMVRWVQALQVGSRVTFPDFRLLEKERQIFASVVLTPRRAASCGLSERPQITAEPPPSLLAEEVDIDGNILPLGTVQPYDEHGNAYISSHDGSLIHSTTGHMLPPTAPRYSANGEQLDSFNRPLPPDAVAMFDARGRPIGVGPDGFHYTVDGRIIDSRSEHYDADGTKLSQEVVDAANKIATNLAVAAKIRARLQGTFEFKVKFVITM